MSFKEKINKTFLRKASNYLFYGLLLLLVFNPTAKAWMLRQFMAVGFFKAEMKKEASAPLDATSFSFRDATGKTWSLEDMKGKVVFINFWATWCPPCLAEMPALDNLYKQFRDDPQFVFLFVNEDDDMTKAKALLQNKGYAIPLATRVGNPPSQIFSGTLPTTIILNKEGKIVFKHEGLANYNTTDFINQLKAL
jgi:thiol-disulfide isomerase/thioredoxin